MPKTCLVVDDNVETVDIVRHILEKAGYEVLAAYDGQMGLDSAKKNHPDVILLDLMMPVVDGYTMNKHLKGDLTTRDIPVIIISARSGMAPMFNDGKGPGIRGYLVKPFSSKELLQMIDGLFKKSST